MLFVLRSFSLSWDSGAPASLSKSIISILCSPRFAPPRYLTKRQRLEPSSQKRRPIAREARQNPSLLRKRILGCSSIFSTGKNPQCITVDNFPVFSRTENQISTQPPLSRNG